MMDRATHRARRRPHQTPNQARVEWTTWCWVNNTKACVLVAWRETKRTNKVEFQKNPCRICSSQESVAASKHVEHSAILRSRLTTGEAPYMNLFNHSLYITHLAANEIAIDSVWRESWKCRFKRCACTWERRCQDVIHKESRYHQELSLNVW